MGFSSNLTHGLPAVLGAELQEILLQDDRQDVLVVRDEAGAEIGAAAPVTRAEVTENVGEQLLSDFPALPFDQTANLF